jgi:hypothetical protein
MSSDRYVTEYLPWYLNGTLDEAETAELQRLLADSEDNRRELEEVREAARVYGHRLPVDVIVDYAFDGRHAEVPTELLERYLAVSPVAGDELALVHESKRALAAEQAIEPTDIVKPFPPPQPGPPARPWRLLAMAASLVGGLALGLTAWQWSQLQERDEVLVRTEQQLREALARDAQVTDDEGLRRRVEALESEREQLAAGKSDLVDQIEARDGRIEEMSRQIAELKEPLMNIPVVDVYPGDMVLRGEPRAERLVVVPRQTRSVALILNSSVEAEQQVTGLDILDADGRQVWQSPIAPERDDLGTFTVALPVQELGVGLYTLQLVDRRAGGTRIVETYQIEIR